MSRAKPGGFDKVGFIAAVKAAIAAQAPKNLDEAAHFSESGKADAVKGQVAGKVTEGKNQSAQDIAEKTSAAPDTSKAVEKPVTPLEAEKPPGPAPVDAAAGMPSKAPAEQTDFSAGKQETDQKMAEADVTHEQLATSNEPEFTGALEAKRAGEQHSATAPGAVRESEAATLTATKQGARADGKAGLAGMMQAKGGSLSKAAAGKAASKAKDEAARAQITMDIKAIFDKTKSEVNAILGGLDAEVAKRFDIGEKAARTAFTADHKARMEKYKDARYSGLVGAGRWTADLFTGLPAEANQVYLEAKKLYESKMEQVISGVADFIGGELTRAKDRIAAGRNQIKDFVAKQPKDLQKVANETSQHFTAQFDQLESDVDAKKDGLVDDLASKYIEARNSVDEEIKAAQGENKGWWDKAKDAVGGAIATVLKLKDMLLGVLARAAGAVGKIIKDPIGFLGNMVNAVKNGVLNFAGNIVEHLKKGLQGWLLGSLAAAGIELPEKFDLKGIIKLVLSILGLTWTAIRSRIVKVIPESVMDKVEKGVAFIQMVLSEGIGGLWKWIAEKMSDLKEMVMGQIKDFVITKIIKAGITWIISLLNPAAAFIKACKMIYDVVMFFVEKAEQIKEFVDSILDSVESIASGGVGAVAGYIEKTLAKTLPVVLGFLASLLGLGGISEKITDVLHTIQKPVMSVVDKLVGGAVKYGKKLMAGAKNLGKKALAKGKALGKKALGKVGRGRESESMLQTPERRLRQALAAAARIVTPGLPPSAVRSGLAALKPTYGLTSVELKSDGGGNFHGELAINPRGRTASKPLGGDSRVIAALRGMGLDEAAIRRVSAKKNVDHIKGQLLEELVDLNMLKAFGVKTKGATLLAGHSVRDASGQPFTDGMVVIRRGDRARLIAFVEAKAGGGAARGLSSERGDRTYEDWAYAADLLKKKRPDLRSRKIADLVMTHRRTLEKLMERELPRSESGQARKDLERAIPSHGGSYTPILVDGKPMKLVGATASSLVLAVLPKDVKLPRLTPETMRTVHGILNFQKVNLSIPSRDLTAMARKISKANIR